MLDNQIQKAVLGGTSNEEPLRTMNKTALGWYVMKVLWRQELKTQERFSEFGLDCYVPMRQVLCEDARHRKQRMKVPAINGLVFVFYKEIGGSERVRPCKLWSDRLFLHQPRGGT